MVHVLHWTMWFLLCFELCHLIYRSRCLKITFQPRTCCVCLYFFFLLWISFVWKCIFSFSNWTYLKVTLQCEFHKMYAYSSSVRFDRRYVQISSRLECYNTGCELTETFELPQPFHENIKIFHEINTDCHPKLYGKKSVLLLIHLLSFNKYACCELSANWNLSSKDRMIQFYLFQSFPYMVYLPEIKFDNM